MQTIFLFNGPPGCGKDTACNYLESKYKIPSYKIARPLKEAAHALLGFPFPDKIDMYEGQKEEETIFGVTLRQVYIDIGKFVTRKYSKYVFVDALINRARNSSSYTVSDLGFPAEAEAFLANDEEEGPEVVIVQIRREGKTFDKDSRNYVDGTPYGIPTVEIINDGPREGLYDRLDILYDHYVKKHEAKEIRMTRNKIQCNNCRDIIESVDRHDFRRCACGSCFIDGGLDYRRIGYGKLGYTDLAEVE